MGCVPAGAIFGLGAGRGEDGVCVSGIAAFDLVRLALLKSANHVAERLKGLGYEWFDRNFHEVPHGKFLLLAWLVDAQGGVYVRLIGVCLAGFDRAECYWAVGAPRLEDRVERGHVLQTAAAIHFDGALAANGFRHFV